MRGDSLTITYDDSDRAVWLIVDSPPLEHRELIWLRGGFSVNDVHEAVAATGWAQPTENGWRLTNDIRCQSLRNVVEEMLGYFKSSGVPTDELLAVQWAVAEYGAAAADTANVSLFACAWLDIMIREDIADTARSSKDIWSRNSINIDCSSYCDARVEELLAGLTTRAVIDLRLAASKPSRPLTKSDVSTG